jgi:hypothetical protein
MDGQSARFGLDPPAGTHYAEAFQTPMEPPMNFRPTPLAAAALLLSANAFANSPALSKDEFDQLIAQPFKATNGKSGLIVEIHLKPDGSAVARKGYNDIGTWRRNGDAGYCVRWNKQRMDDRCTNFVRQDEKVFGVVPPGEVTWLIERAE